MQQTSDSKQSASATKDSTHSSWLLPLILIISLFFLWGMANNLNDILIAQFKKLFTLSDFASGLVQSAFYLGYFICAIPAAIFASRFSYKKAVVTGLCLYALGAFLFYPAAQVQEYYLFLIALFIIACGLAFLETSANPLVLALGDSATAARRLNFAQSFNPLGCLTGIAIGREFILSGHEPTQEQLAAMSPEQLTAFYQHEAQAVQMPYLAIGILVLSWALLVAFTRFPKVATETHDASQASDAVGTVSNTVGAASNAVGTVSNAVGTSNTVGTWQDYRELFCNRLFMLGVIAQFFYVGAQVCLWSYTLRYGKVAMPELGEKDLAIYLLASIFIFMVGRFVATALMTVIKPVSLLLIYALINCFLCAIAVAEPNHWGMYALVANSFFMSLMFPTIFALALKDAGQGKEKPASSLVIMGIVGGAALTALMGLVSDLSSINISVIVPLVCFIFITMYSYAVRARH